MENRPSPVCISVKKFLEMDEQIKRYEEALRRIDTHIRSTPNAIPYIVETLKKTLPEYKD